MVPQKLKIGLDYHGVITHLPKEVLMLFELIIMMGHEIHIMTGSKKSTWDKECAKSGIKPKYTHFLSISDSMIADGYTGTGLDTDNPVFENSHMWDSWKARYAKEHGLHLVIDDSPRYGEYFETPFMLFRNEHNENIFKHELIKDIVKRSR